ncbi:hypothetical protein A8U91_01490 [Halomonas elongata]|uniref:Uncharacterized protein n=1 Tax=Halomonas elongata TaxID=2746 RepID=A0A1B8P4E2_HALEL|nr:hypothetical protein A8U91_01490 [Halomonas elongata]
MVLRVPQEVPAMTDIIEHDKQATTRNNAGDSASRPMATMAGMVPESIQTPTIMPTLIKIRMGTSMA